MNRLRWGILGTGNIARQFAQGLRSTDRHEIAAVGSRSRESAATFAGSFAIPAAYGSYEQLIGDRSVDAIYLSLPNALHHEWTIRSLRAGKHVLCEKPFALNAAQAQEMFDEAHKAGRVLIEAFMYRAHPQTLAVLDAVRCGVIGPIKLIRTSFCYRTNRIDGNIRFDLLLGGGALMDIGCYCINFSRAIAGAQPDKIHAVARMHSSGVDEVVSVLMQFPGNIAAEFSCGMSLQAENTAHLCGSDGFISIPVPWKPAPGKAHYIIGRSIPPKQDLAGGAPVLPPRQVVEIADNRDVFAVEADAFGDCVLNGTPPFVSREDTLGNMHVIDEIRRQIGLEF